MKFAKLLSLSVATSLLCGTAFAAGDAANEAKADAEYMMRKIVEDIHVRSLRMVVTDITLDKSIHVVGKAVKFIPARKDKRTGEELACARGTLNTQIYTGEAVAEKINRTDEICTGKKSGAIKYVANIN